MALKRLPKYKFSKIVNKIHHKDSLKFIRRVPSNSIDLIIIDPPYHYERLDAIRKGEKEPRAYAKKMQGVFDSLREGSLDVSINPKIFPELVRVMKQDKINIYIFCNKAQIPLYLDYFYKELDCSFDILKWVKTNAVPSYNNKYSNDTEYCLYFRKGGYCKPQNHIDGSTVFLEPINQKDKKTYKHDTIKPEPIITRLIKNSSKEGQVVADFYVGSGTTCAIAKKLKRQWLGVEMVEKHYKTAVTRVNKQLVKLS